jgi:hypothetical protein
MTQTFMDSKELISDIGGYGGFKKGETHASIKADYG